MICFAFAADAMTSLEIPMTAPFPPRGENCAIMGISSLPGPTRSAGLGPGVGCELGALCFCRICDGQFRNSQDRSISASRRKLRGHGNFFASGTGSAGLGPGFSCELGALCLRRICDGQFRNSQDRSISALRRKLRDHGNFFASGTDSLRWTRPRGWLRIGHVLPLP